MAHPIRSTAKDFVTDPKWMKKFGIRIRSKSETNKLKIKKCPALGQPAWKPKKGEKSPNWRGGEIIAGRGYLYVYCPNHPSKPKKGYVLKHRLIMEEHLGRYLSCREVVHHINGDHFDNRLENLRLYPSQKEHSRFHKIWMKRGE